MSSYRSSADGFTLVELMIAMALFSFMMLLISVGVIQVMKIYQSGVASRRTQQAARLVMEDITREVRTASSIEASGNDTLCLRNGVTYIKYERTGLEQLTKRVGNSCSDNNAAETRLVEASLQNNNMKARRFDSSKISYGGNEDASVSVTIMVTTGSEDLIGEDQKCKVARGSEFCATTLYTNTVSLRAVNQ